MTHIAACLENTVQCYFFCYNANGDAVYWQQLCEKINERIKFYSKEYIWHLEEFKVHIPIIKESSDIPNHLTSATCFGDNIEDEWFIVYIVFKISEEFKELVIQIRDGDGDFILIEAADSLPAWANPDTTENRVFIYDGNIHLIPPECWDIKEDIKIDQALKFVTDAHTLTASSAIKETIQKRIRKYTNKLQEVFHKAIVLLPIDIAAILKIRASLISPLVNMYCSHDIIDTKMCKNIKYENCVLTEVKFTKCLYAMLHHAKMIKLIKFMDNGAENSKEHSLGIKLTCAYYMIMKESVSDVFSTKRFNNFIQKLQKIGYFKENLEGSIDYRKLLEKAKEFYISKECSLNPLVCGEIQDILSSEDFCEVKTKLQSKDKNAEVIGDNDDWLNISPEQLDDLLTSRYGKQFNFKKDDAVTADTITSKLSHFFKQSSDFEGVETYQDIEDNEINFDADKFQESIETMLNMLSSQTSDMQISNSESSDIESTMSENHTLDNEIKSQLHDNMDYNKESILQNMMQSMKEEQFSGPSSNVLKTIGISKSALLDSDDDSDDNNII